MAKLGQTLKNKTTLDMILSVAKATDKVGSVNTLDASYQALSEMGVFSTKEQALAKEIMHYAHLIMLDLDGALKYAGKEQRKNLLDVALWYGKHPNLIKKMADQEVYANFLLTKAIPYLSMQRDEEGFFLDGENYEFVRDELKAMNKEPREVIRKNLLEMQKNNNSNIPKQILLSKIINNPDLAKSAIIEYAKLTQLKRSHIHDKVKEYCEANGMDYEGYMQEGDADPYFPVASNLFSVNNGTPEVLKENLKLYVDFSNFNGYNQEKEILEKIKHPNIIEYRGTMNIDKFEFLRFGLFEAEELSTHTLKNYLLPPEEAINVVKTLAETLLYLHSKKIMYLDIKDKNVMYDGETVKLLDFGMARILNKKVDKDSCVRSLLSTPAYIPPEWGKEFTAYGNSEVFQMGVLTYQLMTGMHPFSHIKFEEDIRESEIVGYALPNCFNPYNPVKSIRKYPQINELVEGMLIKDHTQRPSMQEVYGHLEKILTDGVKKKAVIM